MRKTTNLEKDIFLYLNDLRESGETNMFGASSYIADEFNMPIRDARPYLMLWMDNFNAEGNYDEIKEKAIKP